MAQELCIFLKTDMTNVFCIKKERLFNSMLAKVFLSWCDDLFLSFFLIYGLTANMKITNMTQMNKCPGLLGGGCEMINFLISF